MRARAWRGAAPIVAVLASSQGIAWAGESAPGAGAPPTADPMVSSVPTSEPGTAAAPSGFPASADAFGPPPDNSLLSLKMYGDTLFQVRDRAPVHSTFAAAHLDLFATADVDRLSFLSEVFFEAEDNEFAVDIERLQVSYLVSNWLRVRMGRTHTAFGYYNDTYHHGNLFELTTARPYAAQFEDEGGLFTAHLVGIGIDGSLDAGSAGSFHYDAEIGNGKQPDTTTVAVEETAKDPKLVNLRLRWLPVDGLIIGANLLHDVVPSAPATADVPARLRAGELVAGAHVVYMDHGVHALLESYLIRHSPSGAGSLTTIGGFAELGYALGALTPYGRVEEIHLPKAGDAIYQANGSFYAGTRDVLDLRLGVDWLLQPQIALKCEVQRLTHDSRHQELATFKAAFGF